ncbi:hypothetical protein F0562_033944 [Nyssa sinensis]|uniref:Uncharacterized protein n=1 Tax=Nyssa sinensis TaxID=561372 RepID=A0A5J5AII7_9ASTE|nr:hypothetical protein F0562_033944 [Nyssa sinensis]
MISFAHLFSEVQRPFTQASIEEIIFAVSFVTAFSLLQLPYETIDGNPVPTIIFKNKSAFFHAFLLSLNFAFSGAVMTISLRERHPTIGRVLRYLAIVSIATAVGIVLWSISPTSEGVAAILFGEMTVAPLRDDLVRLDW